MIYFTVEMVQLMGAIALKNVVRDGAVMVCLVKHACVIVGFTGFVTGSDSRINLPHTNDNFVDVSVQCWIIRLFYKRRCIPSSKNSFFFILLVFTLSLAASLVVALVRPIKNLFHYFVTAGKEAYRSYCCQSGKRTTGKQFLAHRFSYIHRVQHVLVTF